MTEFQYGSVPPGAAEPDVLYDTYEEAVEDCWQGPCRVVRRVLGPWVPIHQSREVDGERG